MRFTRFSGAARCFCPVFASLALAASAATAGVTIAEVAPKNSVLVISIDDASATIDAFNRTGYRHVWDEPSVQKWIEESLGEMFKQAAADLQKLGIEKDQIKRPVGPCGLAWWNDSESKDENGGPPGQMLMLAEYATDAAAMDAVVRQLIEKGEKDKVLELKHSEHDGVTILSCTFLEQPEKAENSKKNEPKNGGDDGDDEEFDLDGGDETTDNSPFGMDLKEVHYALAGTTLIMASAKESVETAIDRVKGDSGPSIGDSEDYNAVVRQLGEQQVRAVMLTREAMAAEEKGPGGEFARKMNELTGLADVRGIGAGLRFDTDAAMMEQLIVVNAPAKKGLLALFDTPAGPLEAPAFVPADAASVIMFQADLPGIVPMVTKIMGEMPQDEGFSPAQMIGGITNMLGPILANLGPQIYAVSSYERPFSPTSNQTFYAVKARDAQALSNAIGTIGAQFGLQSKDFQGNQIWSMEGGMMPVELSIGIGGGYAFFGSNTAVENALRAASAGEAGAAARLSTQDSFKRAMASAAGTGQGFGFVSTRRTFEYLEWSFRNMDKLIAEELDAEIARYGGQDDPDAKAWKERELKQRTADVWPPLKNMPSMDVVYKHVGDTVMELRSTPEGFTLKSLSLRAGAPKP